MSLKSELLAAFKAAATEAPRPVDIKGFPRFYVRDLTIGEVDERNAEQDPWKKAHSLTASAAMAICDEKGEILFDSNNSEEMRAVFKQSWRRMQKIFEVMNRDEEIEGGKLSERQVFAMDLALHLGKSLKEIADLPEREFKRWALYDAKFMLPQRRLEYYLAQVACTIAKVEGNDFTVQDFLLPRVESDMKEKVTPGEALEMAKEALRFTPNKYVVKDSGG